MLIIQIRLNFTFVTQPFDLAIEELYLTLTVIISTCNSGVMNTLSLMNSMNLIIRFGTCAELLICF